MIGGGAGGSFGAYVNGNGGFASLTFASGMSALPAIVPFGSGFTAVFHALGTDALMSTSFAGAGWSAPTAIGGTLAREMPALAVGGTTLHLLYQENDDGGLAYKFFHASFNGTAWSTIDPVGSGADQSYGAHAPAGAADSTSLIAGQIGDDKRIYVRGYGSSWAAAAAIDDGSAAALGSKDALGTAPRMVSMTGGSKDMLLVYTHDEDYKLLVMARSGGAWSGPTQIHANAYTTEPFNVAPLAGGKAIVAWRGADKHGYASIYDGTTWSAPLTVAGFEIGAAPSVAPGNCGSIAIATYVKTGGTVQLVRYDGTSWAAPGVVTTLGGPFTYTGVAVSP